MFLRLLTDTPDQTVILTLDEGRQLYPETFTHYLFILTREENTSGGLDLAQVAEIVSENQRSTSLLITTEPLTSPGRYRYDVYGQNSDSNIDPLNASVVGLVERGMGDLRTGDAPFEENAGTIPDYKRND